MRAVLSVSARTDSCRKSTIALTLSLLTTSMLPPAVTGAERSVGNHRGRGAIHRSRFAYVYFYSLVTMDVTRRQFTNIEPGKEPGKGPMNMFNNVPEYPPASFKGVVRPNFDTLYSIAYLDMTGARHRFGSGLESTILSAADARHVVGRLCFAWMAHTG